MTINQTTAAILNELNADFTDFEIDMLTNDNDYDLDYVLTEDIFQDQNDINYL